MSVKKMISYQELHVSVLTLLQKL